MDGGSAQRYALGTHWYLRLGHKGRHEVVIESHCTGTCDVIVVMAHPKPGAEERVAEDWDWANVLRVSRRALEPLA
jgi:hypothetical protein